ncbi:nucleoside phosphorylase domain-containing protein [Aspergillus heterothallicus]
MNGFERASKLKLNITESTPPQLNPSRNPIRHQDLLQRNRKLTAADYTVGWICALPLELAASEGMLDRLHDAGSLSLSDGDQNSYILGEISGHNVVMACLPSGGMGLTSATTVAAGMMHSFPRIRFGLMVGIGGGAPNPHPSARPDEDIRLGDVVVSIPSGELGAIIKYDRGKVVAGGEFQHTGVLNLPPSVLTTAVSALQCKHETLANSISRSIADMIEFPCPHCDDDRLVPRRPRRRKDPVIHYGPIASADMVMRHGETREKLRKKYGILCFEMEAAGLMNDFPCLVIRGICDYSDTHKNKIWQRYAAATAAGYAKELLGTVKKAEVTEPRLERGAQDELQREHDLKHKELLEWLGPDTHTKKWADSRSKWHQGTGVTFIESQAFVNWFNDLAQTLWCRGIAGSGKTVFSALVLDRLHAARKDTKAAVICLFLEYERTQEQSLQALLAAVLRQLVQQCPEPPSSVVDLHASHTAHQSQPLLEELCSVVVDVMHKFPQVYLVVDALDECPDDAARDLLSNLRDVQQSTGMKLVTTSRPTIDLGEFFGEYETLEIRALEHDVRAVLESRMIKLPRLVREDKSLQKRIKDSIAEAVDGMQVHPGRAIS